jgi:hypothetical protein
MLKLLSLFLLEMSIESELFFAETLSGPFSRLCDHFYNHSNQQDKSSCKHLSYSRGSDELFSKLDFHLAFQ